MLYCDAATFCRRRNDAGIMTDETGRRCAQESIDIIIMKNNYNYLFIIKIILITYLLSGCLVVLLFCCFVVLLFAWRRKSPQIQPLRQRLLPLVTSKRQEKQGSHPKEKDTKKRSNHYWLLRFSILT